jgi:hypothetical protein
MTWLLLIMKYYFAESFLAAAAGMLWNHITSVFLAILVDTITALGFWTVVFLGEVFAGLVGVAWLQGTKETGQVDLSVKCISRQYTVKATYILLLATDAMG